MAKVEIDIDIHENSLDTSADSEYIGMVDEGSFGTEDRSRLGSQPFLDTNENATTYSFRDINGAVTYKLIEMTGDETANNITQSPTHVLPEAEYFVISNPVEVFGNPSQKGKVVRRQPLKAKAVTAKKRDEKRRATHNEVERRRRDKINNWITNLAALVPNSGLPDSASKGGILAKACDYITELTERQKRFEKLEVENEKLVLEILRLNQELSEVRKENTAMRNQLADNCIVHRLKDEKS